MIIKPLLEAATAPGAGEPIPNVARIKTFQVWGATSGGAGTAKVQVQGSNNGGVTWDWVHDFDISFTDAARGDSHTSDERFGLLRGELIEVTGADAVVNMNVGF